MTVEQWQRFDGVCGHQHVPGNDHWDPGDLPVGRIAARARERIALHGQSRGEALLGDHDGPAFESERDDEDEAWTGGFEQLNPDAAPTPPPPPDPPLTGPVLVARRCCMLDPGSLRDTTTMGGYSTPTGVRLRHARDRLHAWPASSTSPISTPPPT